MSTPTKRAYNSDSRHAKAIETKRRILDSAKKLFEKEGFELVTIEKIASASKVSSPTIYSLFQSKRGILRALMDEALPNDQREALVEKVKYETSPEERLRLAAKISRQMYDAERAQMDVFRGASVLSPEFKELEREREERRYKRQEETFKAFWKQKHLIDGLALSKAQDIIWAFTGRDLYRMLVVDKGWTSDEYEEWLGNTLIRSLIKTNKQ